MKIFTLGAREVSWVGQIWQVLRCVFAWHALYKQSRGSHLTMNKQPIPFTAHARARPCAHCPIVALHCIHVTEKIHAPSNKRPLYTCQKLTCLGFAFDLLPFVCPHTERQRPQLSDDTKFIIGGFQIMCCQMCKMTQLSTESADTDRANHQQNVHKTCFFPSLLVKINIQSYKLWKCGYQRCQKWDIKKITPTKNLSPFQHWRAHYVKSQSATYRPFLQSRSHLTPFYLKKH